MSFGVSGGVAAGWPVFCQYWIDTIDLLGSCLGQKKAPMARGECPPHSSRVGVFFKMGMIRQANVFGLNIFKGRANQA